MAADQADGDQGAFLSTSSAASAEPEAGAGCNCAGQAKRQLCL